MGIYLSNMEMPKTPLLVCIYPNGICSDEEGKTYRAVPVPPHGDLIDGDYVKEHLYACETNGRPLHTLELCELLDAINDIPTIIPASEEGET